MNGRRTVGLYALNPQTQRSKWVAIDADYDNALDDLLRLQWELRQDGVEAALEKSRPAELTLDLRRQTFFSLGSVASTFTTLPFAFTSAGQGGSGTGGRDFEVFPRQDQLGPQEFGNAIRGPLGVHQAVKKRYWFYGAVYRVEAQLDYLERLRKIKEDEIARFIAGLEMPVEFRPKPRTDLPPYDQSRREFRILDHVRPGRKRSGNYWTRCPSCAQQGRGPKWRQPGDLDGRSAEVQMLGGMH